MNRVKKYIVILLVLCSINVFAQNEKVKTENLVLNILKDYPLATLADIYKTSFQDMFGAEHLVENYQSVVNYLDKELSQMEKEAKGENRKYFELCGTEGNFIRVYLFAVQDSLVSKEVLADAFVRSTKLLRKIDTKQWQKTWRERCEVIRNMDIPLKNFKEDSLYIENLIAKGEYAWVHSRIYHDVYRPHYRIIERNIFFKEILPLLVKNK
ncbi:MAG: hypothetical protein IJ180_07770 [Bacteroidales bacterium]|nr:hypothetical protein [Bacteroidales bacterium]